MGKYIFLMLEYKKICSYKFIVTKGKKIEFCCKLWQLNFWVSFSSV